ncbi:MAG TPA: PAS domain S-box protein [Candidatus Nanoarchaeia archaeon]|nr:PAS domain S-box protein [Candidatus Nanoarchaeia archaeon]
MSEEPELDILDNLPIGISIINKDMRIEWVNKALRNKGFDLECVKGKYCHQVYKNNQQVCENCPSAQAFRTGETVHTVEIGADKKEYNVTAVPIRDKESGEITKVIEIVNELCISEISHYSFSDKITLMGGVFDLIDDVFFMIDKDFTITFINKKFKELFGNGCIGKKCFQIVHGSDEPIKDCPFVKSLKTGKAESIEFFHPKLKRWFLSTSNPVKDDKGNITACLHFVKDITEQKLTEESLRESEERLEIITKNNPDHILIQDADLRYEFVINPQLGLTEEEMIGKTDFDILSKKDAAYLTEIKDSVLRTGKPKHQIIPLVSKNGSTQYFEGSYFPRYDKDKNVDGIIGYFKNITEKKNTDDTLRESKNKLDNLVTNVPGMIYIGNPDWSAEIISGSEEICGYSPEEFNEGKVNWLDLIHTEDKKAVSAEGASLTKQGRKVIQTYRIIKRDRKIAWVEDHKVSMFDKGAFSHVYGIVYDITDAHESRQSLEESRKALLHAQSVANLGNYLLDIKTGIWTSSEILDNIFGIDEGYPRSIEGWSRLILPEDREMMVNYLMNDVLGRHKPFNKEYRIVRHTDKSVRWVHGLGKLDFNGSEEPIKMFGTIQDITEKKQIEIRLRESEEKYRLLIESATEYIFTADRDGKILSVNAAAARLFRRKKKDIEGKTIFELFPRDIASRYIKNLRKVIAKDIPINKNEEMTVNGRKFFINTALTPIKNKNGEIYNVMGIISDRTAEHQAEIALRESEERYKTLTENSPDCIKIMDKKGNILFMNQGGLKEHHLKDLEEARKFDILSSVMKDDRKRLENALKKAFAGKINTIEIKHIHEGSRNSYCLETFSPIKDSDGRITTVQGISRNITEQKMADSAIKSSELRYRRLFEAAKDGILIVDVDTGMILDANPFIKDILGYSQKEIVKKKLWEISPLKDVIKNKASFSKLQKERYIRYENLPVETKTGKIAYMEFVSNVYSIGDKEVVQCNIRDITSRKKAEDALKESEKSLKEAQGISHVGNWSWNIKKDRILWSEELYRITGIDPKRPIPTYASLPKVYTKESWKRLDSAVKRAVEGGKPYELELDMIRQDKQIIHTLTRGKAIKDISGKIVSLYGTVQDITKQKKSEEFIKQQKKDYQTIFDSSPNLIVYKDREGRVINVNNAFAQFHGLPKEEIIGKTTFDIISPRKVAEMTLKDDLEVINTGKPKIGIERRFISHFSKKEIIGAVSKLPFYSSEGRIIGTISFIMNITERKKMENALNESRDLYSSLFKNMLNGFAYCKMVFDKDKPIDFVYLSVNNSFERLTGLKNVVGKKVSQVIPGIQRSDPELLRIYGRVALTGKPEVFETYVKSLYMWFSISVYCPKEGYFVAIFDVITKRKKAEEDLKQAYEELKKIDEMKSMLLRDVSHEMKNPISQALMSSSLIIEEFKQDILPREDVNRHLGILQKNLGVAMEHLSSVLEFSRLKSTTDIERRQVNFSSLIKDVSLGLAQNANAKHLSFIIRAGDSLRLSGNTRLLQILVHNLLSNAIKFTDTGEVAIDCWKKGDNVIFSVKDTGKGISEKDIKKVFEPFMKADVAIPGLGLGLPICRKIIELHKGSVDVESHFGKGSTFTVTLPATARTITKIR